MKTLYKKGNDRNDTSDDAPLVDMLSKLSSPQILVLDAVLAHFDTLIKNTKTEETDDAYITKLSLSVGRREYCEIHVSTWSYLSSIISTLA